MSLFNFAMPDDFRDLDSYAKTRGTAYDISFEVVCREVLGPTQTRQLRRLIDFTFQQHPKLNLPDYRLRAIEHHLQKRVRQLLDMATELEKQQRKKQTEPER